MAELTSGQKVKAQIRDAVHAFKMETSYFPDLILIKPDTLKMLESGATSIDPVCFWEGGCKLYRLFGVEVLVSPYLKVSFKCVLQYFSTTMRGE